MISLPVSTWEEFEISLARLEEDRSPHCVRPGGYVSDLIFRGQGDANWKLETTLDRFFRRDVQLHHYHKIILNIKPKIEAFTGISWNAPSLDEFEAKLTHENLRHGHFLPYDYVAYLRHHGFPSPLLDWTASPYVAAFFAFNYASEHSKEVAIFAYQEHAEDKKRYTSGKTNIRHVGQYLPAHKRHFLQQSQYTICTVHQNGEFLYASHEDVILENNKKQDLVWKFTIPTKERYRALKSLSRMNINAFSLFGSEESLISTIATNDVVLKAMAGIDIF